MRDRLQDRSERFSLLGADREAVIAARGELWEEQLRALAGIFGTSLASLPRKKSDDEKLRLAAAMKSTTSVSRSWLAQRLQMGVPSSLGPLLHKFRRTGALDRPEFKAALSRIPA